MEYRLTESNHYLYLPIHADELRPLEEACFLLAKEAHEKDIQGKDQVRKKEIFHRYITHPTLAYRVLKAVGVNDWITTGSVFTHDCLEQGIIDGKKLDTDANIKKGKKLYNNLREKFNRLISKFLPEGLVSRIRSDFMGEVTEDFSPDKKLSFTEQLIGFCEQTMQAVQIDPEKKRRIIELYAGSVEEIVDDVSNSQEVEGKIAHKRFEQILHSEKLSNRAKIVKMADFAASLIDDIIVPQKADNLIDAKNKRLLFIHRAWDVTKKCRNAHPLLATVIEILKDMNLEQIQTDKATAKKMGKDFSLETVIEQAKEKLMASRDEGLVPLLEDMVSAENVEWLNNPLDGKLEKGIEGVKLLDGKITNFRIIADPSTDKKRAANRALWHLVDAIEQKTGNNIDTGNLSITPHYNIVLKMRLDKPMSPYEFVRHASDALAIDDEFAQGIKEHVKQHYPHVGPDTSISPGATSHSIGANRAEPLRTGWAHPGMMD